MLSAPRTAPRPIFSADPARHQPIARMIAGLGLLGGLFNLSPALALTLGEVVDQSPLGAPLSVEIHVPHGDPADAASCLRLITSPAGDGLPVISQARISAAPNGKNRVRISSEATLTEPIVRLQIENTCQSRLRRDYVLLVPFPAALKPPKLSAPSAPITAPSSAAASPRPAPRPAAKPSAPPATETWIMAEGESVQSLARALYPDDSGARARFIASTLRANPELLPDASATSQALKAGTELKIPDLRQVASPVLRDNTAASPAPSSASSREQAQLGRAAGGPASVRSSGPEQDRLVIARTKPAEQPALQPGSDTGFAAKEARLLEALDEQMVRQMELAERIRQLEALQASLLKQLEDTIGRPAAAPPVSAEPPIPLRAPSPPAHSDSNWLPLLLAMLGGGLIALGINTLMSRLRTRRSDPFEEQALAHWIKPGELPASIPTAQGAARTPAPVTAMPPAVATVLPAAENSDMQFPDQPSEDGYVEEHDSAVELAEIMMSFGRLHGAAETLAEFIRSNPKQSVTPWLKLLDVYYAGDMQEEFNTLAQQLNKTFNVQVVTWENYAALRASSESLEGMPHIIAQLQKTWNTRDCQAYLNELIRDNRGGTRLGFPLPVVDDLLTLSAVLEATLGPYRPRTKPEAAA